MQLIRHTTNRAVKTLNRRRDWLVSKKVQSIKEIPFDRAEKLALELCIDILNALMQGQKVEVASVYHHRTKHIVRRVEQRASGELGQDHKKQNEILS